MTQTHELTFEAGAVTKRYTSWARDEPRREWKALRHLHRHAPDLVPRPVAADLDGAPPTVTMTIVEGRPLAGEPAPAAYDAALAWWHGPDPALLGTRPDLTVLGHRDPNLTNYLWDGRRVRIVDFEDAAISDPATELAILLEHLSARHLDTAVLCAELVVDPVRLLAARRLWAMFWLWLFRPGGPAERRNPPGAAQEQARRLLHLLR